VYTSALSSAHGYFKLNMEGYDTEAIAHNESAISFKQKLESLHTIYTVNVHRETVSERYQLFAWRVTFTHMKNERIQGAGNLPPMTVSYLDMTPLSSASVRVF
jgi:hypothetical protein